MRKLVPLVAALHLLAASCGSENEAELTTTEGTSEPRATETAAPEATAKAGGAAGGGSGGQAGGGEAQEAPAPVQPAPEGGVNRPRAGTYVYNLDGKASDPTNPTAPEREYREDAEVFADVSHSGDVTTMERSTSEEGGVFTTRTRWEVGRVLLLSVKTEVPILGTFSCSFDPPLLIATLPIKPETFPTQEFKGSGNACNGKLDITVVQQEPSSDANGKSWSTWQIKVHTEASSSQFSTVSDDVRWFSPDLGMEIRTDGKTNGSFKTQAGTSQNFSSESHTALKKHP